MRRPMTARLLLLIAATLLAVPAAAQQVREPEDPESLYGQGLRQMKRGYYDEAIITFERVRNHFPFNQYSVLSELKVADCLYEKSSYVEAVDAYRQFARLHPRHPDIDYVVYRTARAEFKLAPTIPQRDQTHSKRGLRRLDEFERRFPESEYTPEVERLRGKVQLRLSRAAVQIGNFYWKQKEWSAAERRYRLAIEEYPDSPLAAKAQYRRGLCLLQLDDVAGATAAFEAVIARWPDTRWAERAQGQLDGASKDTTGSDSGDKASTSS